MDVTNAHDEKGANLGLKYQRHTIAKRYDFMAISVVAVIVVNGSL